MLNCLSVDMKNRAAKVFTNELAWSYPDIIDAIDFARKNGFVVLGGHILEKDLTYTYDKWNYDYEKSITGEENITNSSRKAIEYVEDYRSKYGDSFYYSIMCEQR